MVQGIFANGVLALSLSLLTINVVVLKVNFYVFFSFDHKFPSIWDIQLSFSLLIKSGLDRRELNGKCLAICKT